MQQLPLHSDDVYLKEYWAMCRLLIVALVRQCLIATVFLCVETSFYSDAGIF